MPHRGETYSVHMYSKLNMLPNLYCKCPLRREKSFVFYTILIPSFYF